MEETKLITKKNSSTQPYCSKSKSSWQSKPQVIVAIPHFFLELNQFGKSYLLFLYRELIASRLFCLSSISYLRRITGERTVDLGLSQCLLLFKNVHSIVNFTTVHIHIMIDEVKEWNIAEERFMKKNNGSLADQRRRNEENEYNGESRRNTRLSSLISSTNGCETSMSDISMTHRNSSCSIDSQYLGSFENKDESAEASPKRFNGVALLHPDAAKYTRITKK
ncbi:unnamed protein product [Lepeophtheirus salmonis]|uniref:(salmon louse) hypothetical protein n=1 Tax=Lepeophtheirus salmonis TaxID=72036 RepID=A0A7R8CAU3_LEPSM|nr:unnamed protein product [Lepeophtheirus salmonis]CAF2754592.1 unnamed protein product [Lepeophtheirus salmonis]